MSGYFLTPVNRYRDGRDDGFYNVQMDIYAFRSVLFGLTQVFWSENPFRIQRKYSPGCANADSSPGDVPRTG